MTEEQETSLERLDFVCEFVMKTRGSLRNVLSQLDYQIGLMIELCRKAGVSKKKIIAVLSKFEPPTSKLS